MKKLLFFLICLPLAVFSQKNTKTFGKFINSDGLVIKGSSVERGYEWQFVIQNLVANSSNNNTIVSFDTPTGQGIAAFRDLANGKNKLQKGEITITVNGIDRRIVSYKISMQDIAVTGCSDDANTLLTHITLNATRIGWTYYDADRMGRTTVSSKTGWDSEKNSQWTNF